MNHLPKSVVREIRTLRSVGTGGGRPPPVTRWMWKRSHGGTTKAPPDERGGNRYVQPEISSLLVPNPVMAVNVSPAYLFRKVGGDEPVTLLYDEIDTVFGPKARENEEIRALLNAGHRKGAVAGRCVVRGKNIETEDISAYAAVALAGLGWLPDTIMTRSVVIRMRRRHDGERVEPYRPRIHGDEGYRIRNAIAVWARTTDVSGPTCLQRSKTAMRTCGSRSLR